MRKDRYCEQVKRYFPSLRRIALRAGLSYDDACDTVSQCNARILESRKYKMITPIKLKAFLHTLLRFGIQNFKRTEMLRDTQVARLPDEYDGTDSYVAVLTCLANSPGQNVECPFCFHASLNMFGACAMCHTIVPSYIRLPHIITQMTHESLACEFDFHTALDVQAAIARLTPFEQQVVTAVGLGNETLEGFAADTHYSTSMIFRTWMVAKIKLQEYLYEYDPEGVSKRGVNAFRAVLQQIEKQREKQA